MKALRLFAIVSLLALPALADLTKYKDWGNSPQGYFMTKAERVQWSAIRSDVEAETFVNQFLASRGPEFVEEIAKRTAMADKYLTVGSTPGSRTLRGKIIILLGPPTSFRAADRQIEGSRSTTLSFGGGSNDGHVADQGPSMEDMGHAADRSGMSGKLLREFTIGYDAKKLPPSFDKDLSVIILADPTSGKDRLDNQRQMADLEKGFEMVAAASVKK